MDLKICLSKMNFLYKKMDTGLFPHFNISFSNDIFASLPLETKSILRNTIIQQFIVQNFNQVLVMVSTIDIKGLWECESGRPF